LAIHKYPIYSYTVESSKRPLNLVRLSLQNIILCLSSPTFPVPVLCLPLHSCTLGQKTLTNFITCYKAIRNVCNTNYNQHSLPLFKWLRIFPLNELTIFTSSLLMLYSTVHKYGPRIPQNQRQTKAMRNPNVEL
jgi:hypothetical protein